MDGDEVDMALRDMESMAEQTANIVGQSSAAAAALRKMHDMRAQGHDAVVVLQKGVWVVCNRCFVHLMADEEMPDSSPAEGAR